jgi:hypothetical protein
MKEKCFAYQNKKTLEWLKIYTYWNGVFEFCDSFDKSVLYSARNIIEEDFYRIKLEDREDWQLMKVEIEYKFNKAEI